MGLDAVEIIMRTEDEFSITILDDEAETVVTVGDLYRILLAKLDVTPGCLTSKAFYRTRRTLVEVLGLPRNSIRPSTRLSALLPDEIRRTQWEKIRQNIGLAMPALRIPSAIKQGMYKGTFFVTGALTMLASFVVLSKGWSGVAVFPLGLVLWIVLFWSGSLAMKRLSTPRFATELPADTAGELAQVVLVLNQDTFQPAKSGGRETDEDVWHRLVNIICDQLQIDKDEVVANARFVDDLGVS